MSGEDITSKLSSVTEDQLVDKNNKVNSRSRVDINVLLNKVRLKNKKQKFENIVFISLIASVILVTGIIASL